MFQSEHLDVRQLLVVTDRAVTIRKFWRPLIVGKIIAIDDYIYICIFFFIVYYYSIMSFNSTHSVLYTLMIRAI